jgi:hypothetical protein
LKAFVIPTSQTTADRDRDLERLVVDDLDRQPAREHDRRRRALGGQLRERRQRPEVVRQAREEQERGAGHDPEQLAARVDRTGRGRRADGGEQAEEDPDPADQRRPVRAPALASGLAGEPSREGGAEREPDRGDGDGQGQERRDGGHGLGG